MPEKPAARRIAEFGPGIFRFRGLPGRKGFAALRATLALKAAGLALPSPRPARKTPGPELVGCMIACDVVSKAGAGEVGVPGSRSLLLASCPKGGRLRRPAAMMMGRCPLPPLGGRSSFLAPLLILSLLYPGCQGCSELDKFAHWIDEFMKFCEKGAYDERSPQAGQPVDWFANCDWVTCECLWQSLKVPVPTDEVTMCFEQGMRLERITQEHQQFTLAILEKFRTTTELLSEPCAVCDQYAPERPQCSNGTTLRTRPPVAGSSGKLGASAPTGRPIATAGARGTRHAAGLISLRGVATLLAAAATATPFFLLPRGPRAFSR